MEYNRAELIVRDPRGKEILESIAADPEESGPMSDKEIEELAEMVKIYERMYLEDFITKHPDFPAKAAMAFTDMYEKEQGLGNIIVNTGDLESITIPSSLREFQLVEFRTAVFLKAFGCSERTISEFLGRNRETVRKYLGPVVKIIEDTYQLSQEEHDAAVGPVIKNIVESLPGGKPRAVQEG